MGEEQPQTQKEHEEAVSQAVVKKIYELMTAAMSLVAALAWNDAIQTLFQKLFGPSSTLMAKVLYALLVTAMVVWLGNKMAKLSRVVGKRFKRDKSENVVI